MPGTVRVPGVAGLGSGPADAVVDAGGGGDYTEINAACTALGNGATIAVLPGTYNETADIQLKPGQSILGLSSLEDANPGVLVVMGDNILDLVTNSAIGSRIEGMYFRFAPTTDEFKIQLGAVADDSLFRDLVFDFTSGAAAHSGIQDLSDRTRWYNIAVYCNNSSDAPLLTQGSDCIYDGFRFTGGNTTGVQYIECQNGNRNIYRGFRVTNLNAMVSEILYVRDLAGNFDYNTFDDFYLDAGGLGGVIVRADANFCKFNNFTLYNTTSNALWIRQSDNQFTNFIIKTVYVGILFDATNAARNQFENVLIDGATNRGMNVGGPDCQFNNITMVNTAGTYCIDWASTAVRCLFSNMTCDDLVNLDAPDCRFSNCSLEAVDINATALETTFSSCQFSSTVNVANNADRCCFTGCDADGTVNITGDNTLVAGCNFQTVNTAVTANVNGVSITGCRISLFTNGNPNNANFTSISCCQFGTFNDTGGFSTFRDKYTMENVVANWSVRMSRHYHNDGAVGAINGTLPTGPIDGVRVRITCMTAQTIKLTAAAGDIICIGGSTSVGGGTVESNTPYSSLELVCIEQGGNDLWIATEALGTWVLT